MFNSFIGMHCCTACTAWTVCCLYCRSGEHTVAGRSVMVHADPDDLGQGGHALSCTTGNAGARVACGEIKMQ